MGGGVACPRLGRVFSWCLLAVLCCVSARNAESQAAASHLQRADAIAYDTAGNLYIADAKAHQVFEATLAGQLIVVAGTGTQGFAGDGGPAVSAQLNQPQGLTVGGDGTLYIADTGNGRVRAVDPGGVISTLAGTGMASFSGDGGLAVAAAMRGPTALALRAGGSLLICDTGNQRLRQVVRGVISTVAGTGVQGSSGDGGPAVAAELDGPSGVSVDGSGRIFVADTHNHRIRAIDASGVITTFAGTGTPGFAGDGGPAAKAQLSSPRGLAPDAEGNLLLADAGNERVRRISADGVISTLAGSGVEGGSVDGAAVAGAAVRGPRAVAVSSFGLPVFADTGSATVREVTGSQSLYQPAALTNGRQTKLDARAAMAVTYGQNTLLATVSGLVGVPQGRVQAWDGDIAIASAGLSSGSVQLDLSSLGAGVHTVALHYLGDGLNPAAAGDVEVTVSPAALIASATSATVAYGGDLPLITGVLSGVLPHDAAQVAAVYAAGAGALPPVGSYPIIASLTGPRAANYTVAMAQGSGQLTVTKANSEASLAALGQAYVGMPLALSARVNSSTRGQPTGSVQFLDGNTVVATGTLSNGYANAVYPGPPVGFRTLSLQYLGDTNFLPSSSQPADIAVSALPDFGVGSSGPQSATTTAGGIASYALVVTAQPGPFTGAVAFSMTGLPSGASASFSPPQVVPGAGSATVMVSIQTSGDSAGSAKNVGGPGGVGRISLALLAMASFGVTWRRSKRNLLWLCGAAALLSGCGARTVGEGLGGVVAKTYTLQITGTGTNLAGAVVSHSVPLTLTVKQ